MYIAILMLKTYKYCLEPAKEQNKKLAETLNISRPLYNNALAGRTRL